MMLIKDGNGGWGEGGGERVKVRPRAPTRKTEEARTMEVLRRCPVAIEQQLVYYATAVSTAVLGSHKDNVRCTAVE